MMGLGISFEELLRYEEEQTQQWREFFARRPHLLKVEVSSTDDMGKLLFHMFAAEYRSAQRLLGETMVMDADLRRSNVDELFEIAAEARRKLRQYLASATNESLEQSQTFPSHTLGEFRATPKKLLTHALVHSIRHWAQVARVLRENGQRADFSHDVLFSKAIS